MLKKHFICFTWLMAMFLLPFHAFSREAEATEVAEDGHKPTYMGLYRWVLMVCWRFRSSGLI